jgi:hypothetical protein
MEELELLNRLIAIVGDAITLAEAKTWLEVKENAERLRQEGHVADDPKK